jgi:hypothetical protein
MMRQPEIREAVARYAEQMMPIGDLRAVARQMEANLQHLALHSPNDRVRLEACRSLIAICERREEQQGAGLTIDLDGLIAEVAELAPQPTLEVEVVGECADASGDESES